MRGRKRRPGSAKALALAVLVHVVLLAVLLVSFRWSAIREPQPVVQATVVQEQATVRPRSEESRQREQEEARKQAAEDARRKAEEEKARAAEAKRQRDEEARKQAETKKRQEEEQRQKQVAEQKRKAQEQEKEKARQAEEAKRRKAEEEKARAAEARATETKRRQEEDARRRQAEQSLKEQLAAEESERAAAAKAARAQTAIEKYKALIRQRVTRNWSRPMGSAKGLTCVVQVKLVPGGEVVQARVVRSSGDPVFDRSVENAVFKSTPLPLPQDKDLFEYFREIEFLFSPEA